MRRRAVVAIVASSVWFVACGGGGGAITTPRGPSVPSFRIVSGAGTQDTIDALQSQPLVIELRDTLGKVLAGKYVNVAPYPLPNYVIDEHGNVIYPGEMAVLNTSDSTFGNLAVVVTDSLGRASVSVKFGTRVGAARITLTCPNVGAADTARYTVLAGAIARFDLVPHDTAAIVATTAKFTELVEDRHGNLLPGTRPITAGSPGLTVTAAGAASATTFGRYLVLSQPTASEVDTAYLSVIPSGNVVAYGSGGLYVAHSDGTGLKIVAGPSDAGGMSPVWSDSGSSFLYVGQPLNGDPGPTILRYYLNGSLPTTVLPANYAPPGAAWPSIARNTGRLFFEGLNGSGVYQAYQTGRGATEVPTVLPGLGTAAARRPGPSPDGRYVAILYSALVYSPDKYIRVVDLQSGTLLPWQVAGGTTPRYSPDGTMISFIGDPDGIVRVMRTDGTNIRQVSPAGETYSPYGYDWLPDSRYLIARNSVDARLHLIDTQGGASIPLSFKTELDWVSWRP